MKFPSEILEVPLHFFLSRETSDSDGPLIADAISLAKHNWIGFVQVDRRAKHPELAQALVELCNGLHGDLHGVAARQRSGRLASPPMLGLT